ncbi:MAG: hypothetical protein FWD26_00680 [Treponema sp.]|nr:hypothetical protein [Treponema sp.]
MIWLDTNEKMKWLIDALENNELQLVSRKLTEEDSAEIRREIAEFKAKRNKPVPTEEYVFA